MTLHYNRDNCVDRVLHNNCQSKYQYHPTLVFYITMCIATVFSGSRSTLSCYMYSYANNTAMLRTLANHDQHLIQTAATALPLADMHSIC